MCFAPLTLEPAADQLITTLVVVIREKVKIHDTLVGREVLGGGRSCDGRSWNVVYVLTSRYLWGITNLVGETFR